MVVKHTYSTDFKKLKDDVPRITQLMSACSFNNATFNDWEEQRYFIHTAINKDGELLDVGCGNGFLIKCLSEWSGFKIIPYGIDIDANYIKQAKELFPEYSGNFKTANFYAYLPLVSLGMCLWCFKKFDYVLWNVWDNYHFSERGLGQLNTLLNRVKNDGKLILTFYDPKEGSNKSKIDFLLRAGFKLEAVYNSTGHEAMAVLVKN